MLDVSLREVKSKEGLMTEKHILKPETNLIVDVSKIQNYIQNCDCRYLTLDLSHYNIIDSIKLAAVAMTAHFIKYTDGRVKIVVEGKEAKSSIEKLKLRNSEIVIATELHSAKIA